MWDNGLWFHVKPILTVIGILCSSVLSSGFYISSYRNQVKSSDSKDEASKAAAKVEKEKKDAMANIDINNYASLYIHTEP